MNMITAFLTPFCLITNLLNEGGPLFMYTLLLLLFILLGIFLKEFVKNDQLEKTLSLLHSVSLFALVWGFLGQIIGLIGAFDQIESLENVSPAILAGGLKIASLSPAFGMLVFLIGRLFIIVLTSVR